MKKIGSGLQVDVYDLGGERVLKVHRSKRSQIFKLLFWSPSLLFRPKRLFSRLKEVNDKMRRAVNVLSQNEEYRSFLGNLYFDKNGIVQDRVSMLSDLFGKDVVRDKELVDGCIECMVECWKRGFADRVYNFHVNNGIGKDGRVVQVDFGEISFNKDELKEDAVNRFWETRYFYKRGIKGEAKEYYHDKMRETVTVKNIDKYWGVKNDISD